MINQYTYSGNKQLSYNDFGKKDGFPVLVQHGSVASIKDTGLLESLGEHARVICVARPGYGDSSPHVLNSMLDYGAIIAGLAAEMKIAEFDVLSSSAGAPYGYAIAKACGPKTRNLYVFSGTPALYDEEIQKGWPFPVAKNLTIEESQKIAYDVFFSHCTEKDREQNDVKDSMANNCFGEAQNLRIRFKDWGFSLAEIGSKVFMQHSKKDGVIPYPLAVKTAALLGNCELELLDEGDHFTVERYESFLQRTVIKNFDTLR